VGDRSILKAGTASLRSLVVPEVKQIEVKQFPVAASTMPGFPVGVSMGKRLHLVSADAADRPYNFQEISEFIG
jgi:hypothetical protein